MIGDIEQIEATALAWHFFPSQELLMNVRRWFNWLWSRPTRTHSKTARKPVFYQPNIVTLEDRCTISESVTAIGSGFLMGSLADWFSNAASAAPVSVISRAYSSGESPATTPSSTTQTSMPFSVGTSVISIPTATEK